MRNGKGIFKTASGEIIEGEFVNNEFVNEGFYLNKEGSLFSGTIVAK